MRAVFIIAAVVALVALALWQVLPDPEPDFGPRATTERDAAPARTETVAEGEVVKEPPTLTGVEAGARGPVVVVARSPSGLPLRRYEAEAIDGERSLARIRLDENGVARFDDLPYDGSVAVRVKRAWGRDAYLPVRYGSMPYPVVRGPRVDYVPVGEIEFRVEVVDAWTGDPIDCPVELANTAPGVLSPRRVEGPEPSWRLLVPPGGASSFAVLPEEPDGYVVAGALGPRIRPSARTRVVRWVRPLRREAIVLLEGLKDKEGQPDTREVFACHIGFADRWWHYDLERQGSDAWRVRGLPFYREQPITIHLSATDGWMWKVKARLPEAPWIPLHVPMGEPQPPGPNPSSASIPPLRQRRSRPPLPGRLDVRVLHHDGEPAVHVTVTASQGTWRASRRTDGKGRTSLPAPLGTVDIETEGHAFLPVSAQIEVISGSTHAIEMNEPRGGRVTFEVVGGGKPCPFARVILRSPVVDLEGDVLRVDDLTDVGGRRVFPRVQAGTVPYTVVWAGRQREGTVEVREGIQNRERVILPWD